MDFFYQNGKDFIKKEQLFINHNTVCTTLIQRNIPMGQNGTGCAVLPQGRGKMV